MECKDYIQIISLIATIITSNWLVSRQIKKNKRSGWIEDFRKEVASFTTYGLSITPNSKVEDFGKVIQSSTLLILLLDDDDEQQKFLISKIAETTVLLTKNFTSESIAEFSKKHQEIIKLAKKIISRETSRL